MHLQIRFCEQATMVINYWTRPISRKTSLTDSKSLFEVKKVICQTHDRMKNNEFGGILILKK